MNKQPFRLGTGGTGVIHGDVRQRHLILGRITCYHPQMSIQISTALRGHKRAKHAGTSDAVTFNWGF